MVSTIKPELTYMVNDMGKSLTLRSVAEGAYDPSTGVVVNTNTDTSTIGMLLNYHDRQFLDTNVERTDKKIVLRATDGVVPKINDIVIDGTKEYKIIDVKIHQQKGVDLVYVCQGRG